MPHNTTKERVTLLSLCREAQISVKQLAQEADVPSGDCYAVEIGGFCTQDTAQKVLEAYNRLSGQARTLEEIQWYPMGRASA